MAIFYKIVCPSNNSISYLMGTFHLNHTGFEPILNKAYDLISKSSHYYGEMDLNSVDPIIVSEVLNNQPKASHKIKSLLNKKRNAFQNKFGFDVNHLAELPLFSMLNELTTGLFNEKLIAGSIDEELLKKAIENKLTLGGLETFEEQMQIMKSLKSKDIEKQIIEMLHHPSKFGRSMDKVFKYYLKGKARKLQKEAKKNTKGNSSILIDKRNKIMTSRILEIIKQNDKNFFSFGAGHLSGSTGITTLLKKQGIFVEKVK